MRYTDKKHVFARLMTAVSLMTGAILIVSGAASAEEIYEGWADSYDWQSEQQEQYDYPDAQQPQLYAEDYYNDDLLIAQQDDGFDDTTGDETEYAVPEVQDEAETADSWDTYSWDYPQDTETEDYSYSEWDQYTEVYPEEPAPGAEDQIRAETAEDIPEVQNSETDPWTIYSWVYLQDTETEEYTYSEWDKNIEIMPADAGEYFGAEVYISGMKPGDYKISIQLMDDLTCTWTAFIKEEKITILDEQESMVGKIAYISFGDEIPEAYRASGLYNGC